MKPTEVRIGNWIEFNDESNDCTQVKKIEYTEDETGKVLNYFFNALLCKDYRPILITEQWLKDFGFGVKIWNGVIREYFIAFPPNRGTISVTFGECYPHHYQSKGRKTEFDHVRIKPESSGSIYGIDKIKYVHQLQNLCFALTGKELSK